MAERIVSRSRWTKADGDNPPPKGQNSWPCRSQPGGCHCHCHKLIISKARSRKLPRNAWLPAHDTVLKRMLSEGQSIPIIADALTDQFGVTRTVVAVQHRLEKIGVSSRDGWWSSADIRRRLGVGEKRFDGWVRTGVLSPSSRGHWDRFKPDVVETFVRDHAGVLFDPRHVNDSRLRSLAETSAIVNRRRQSIA